MIVPYMWQNKSAGFINSMNECFYCVKHFKGRISGVKIKTYISKHRHPGVTFFAQTLYLDLATALI